MTSTQQPTVHPGIVSHSHVLIIGPRASVAQNVIQSAFTRRGHATDLASIEGITSLDLDGYDLLILELDVDDAEAAQFCVRLRRLTLTPLLVLVPAMARSQGIKALELGADSFVVIPFDRRELMARSEALVRRHRRLWFPLYVP